MYYTVSTLISCHRFHEIYRVFFIVLRQIVCMYDQGRICRDSLGYPGFWGIIKAEAIKREIFEDFYLGGYPGLRKLNTPLTHLVKKSGFFILKLANLSKF